MFVKFSDLHATYTGETLPNRWRNLNLLLSCKELKIYNTLLLLLEKVAFAVHQSFNATGRSNYAQVKKALFYLFCGSISRCDLIGTKSLQNTFIKSEEPKNTMCAENELY